MMKTVGYSKIFQILTLGCDREFSVKNPPKNNLATNEPISKHNVPIDSARQTEKHEDFKNLSKFVSGEQPGNFPEKLLP
jgi:hypothetical protein